jgi:hypothetical protein
VTVLSEIADQARQEREEALDSGKKDHNAYYVLGTGGIVFGLIAGGTGFAEAGPLVTGIAGLVAAGFTALQTFLKPEERATYHWDRAADFADVALEARQYEEAGDAGNEAVTHLRNRLAEIRRRQFQAVTPPNKDPGS